MKIYLGLVLASLLVLSGCNKKLALNNETIKLSETSVNNVDGYKCRYVDTNGFSELVFFNEITFDKPKSSMRFLVLDRESTVSSQALIVDDSEVTEVQFHTSSFPSGANIDSIPIPQIVSEKFVQSSEIIIRYWQESRGRVQFFKRKKLSGSQSPVIVTTSVGSLESCSVAKLNELDLKVRIN